MTHTFAFISGFLLCLALCWKRLRESRRAFGAACELAEIRRERERRYQETLSKIRELAERMKLNIDLDLGGRAMLPAPAEPTGQHFSLRHCSRRAGLLVNGGPDFLGGKNEQ